MIGRGLALGFALLWLTAGTAYAQDDYARSGVYIGLGGTYAIDTSVASTVEDFVGVDVDVDDMLG